MRRMLILIVILALFNSCSDYIPFLESQDNSFESISMQNNTVYISENNGNGAGKPVTISVHFDKKDDYSYTYQWYTCSSLDKEESIIIEGAIDSNYTTPEIEIIGKPYYYYCIVTESKGFITKKRETKVYSVCCTGLPTVYLTTADRTPITNKEDWVPATLRFVSNDEDLELKASAKGRGNASWDYFPKRSYTIKLDKKNSIGDLPKSKRWVMVSNYNDKTLLRNWFASYMDNTVFGRAGDWDPSYIHVDCILNGEYIGNYTLTEQIRIDSNRINIPDITETDLHEEGGFILEANFRLDEAYNFISSTGIPFSLKDPDMEDMETEIASEIFEYIKEKVCYTETILKTNEFDDIAKVIDVDSFIDWYCVNEIAKTFDGRFRTSVYMYYDPSDGLFHMGPDWDFDDSWGGSDFEDRLNTENFYMNESGWYLYLFSNDKFVQLVKERWNSRYQEALGSINALQIKADEIKVSADMNFIKWDILGTKAFTSAPGYKDRKTYQSEVDFMKKWIKERLEWLNEAINEL